MKLLYETCVAVEAMSYPTLFYVDYITASITFEMHSVDLSFKQTVCVIH